MYHQKFFPAKKYKWTVYPLYFIKDMIDKRRNNEKDNIILVTGARGSGKSTIVGKILFQFEDFDPFKCIVYDKENMFKLVKEKKGYVWGDESIINVAKGNVMTRANKFLFELFTINRDNFNTIFLLMPNIEDFDTKILQYVSLWIHVEKRGLAVMLMPSNEGLLGKKKWDIDGMKKLYEQFQKETENKGYHMPYWVYSNFRGYIKFGKLTQQQDAIVKEIKALRKNENLDKQMEQTVTVEVKELTNYQKYTAIKLADLVMKGELRDLDVFKAQCTELKVDFDATLKKVDAILRRNGIPKTTKGKLKEYEREDTLLKF